jgi:Uma2 family endonuclease
MSAAPTPPAVLDRLELRRFNVQEYHRLIETGILNEGDRVELLEGLLVQKMVRNPRHDLGLSLTEQTLRPHLPSTWFCRVQSAITTADSEPEPDLAVVRAPPRRYAEPHPRPEDVLLVVEVADASLARDRVDKARLYARAAIGQYWIVNVADSVLEVHTEPDPGAASYAERRILQSADSVELTFPGAPPLTVRVSELLP